MAHYRIALLTGLALFTSHTWASGPFYEEAIPTLPVLLKVDQLPGKSISAILPEPKGAKPDVPKKFDFLAELKKMEAGLATGKPADFVPLLEEMSISARWHPTLGVSSLLFDLRDLFSAPDVDPKECAGYLRWRLGHTEPFEIIFGDPAAYSQFYGYDQDERLKPLFADIDAHIAKASPTVLPHWLYLRGAVLFKSGKDTECDKWFMRVLENHPKHARAQSALFMHARSLLSQSRSYDKAPEGARYSSDEARRNEARKVFQTYLAQYPKGYFAGDTIGWLGAINYDAGDYIGALAQYLKQLALHDHPEFEPSASEMCGLALSHIASAPDDTAFAKIAKDPVLAQTLVYLIVDSVEADNFNGKLDEMDEVVKWRREVLPRVAAAVAKNKESYQDPEWQPRYLSMLALASSGAGKQNEALKLVESAPALVNSSDDLAFTRAVVLQRAAKYGEACQAYREFLEKFPDSPLAEAVPLRMAMAHIDNHEAGLALSVLDKWLAKRPQKADDDPYREPMTDGVLNPPLEAQAYQIIDTILNFSPVTELLPALEKDRVLPQTGVLVRGAIAQRYLAHEDFKEAAKYLTPAQWGLAAEGLEKLTILAKTANTPEAKAAAYINLANAWSKARGRLLTAPLDSGDYRTRVYFDQASKASTNRIANAGALPGKIKAGWELESRDELRHAFNWWLEASDITQDPKQKAAAIYNALMAMPAIADVSPFTLQNAQRRDWSAVSRKLYDRLKKECPDSREAQRLAVYWDFTLPEKEDHEFGRASSEAFGDPSFSMDKSHEPKRYEDYKQFLELEKDAKVLDAVAFRKKVELYAKHVRKDAKALEDQFVVNFLDDLALFVAEPDPGKAARQLYVELRTDVLRTSGAGYDMEDSKAAEQTDPVSGQSTFDDKLRERIAKALHDPKMAKVKDYVAFLDLAVVANHWVFIPFPGAPDKNGEKETYWGRDYVLLSKLAGEFLEAYPKSKKREAALLLYARGTYRAMKPLTLSGYVDWPAAKRWEGSYTRVSMRRMPLSPKKLSGILDTYDREFPKGQYSADVQSFRTGLALMERDWPKALNGFVAQLDDHKHPWLQPEAGDLLWELFNELDDDRYRFDVLAAVSKSRDAKRRLQEFLDHLHSTHPLFFMRTYLRDQLAGKK